ncbi:MAG: diversity-generating retroelement protein Avd [Chloroflexi bacterium]|nr:diversity-generating retroelement protein Avd [Chloroflexota bacterium]
MTQSPIFSKTYDLLAWLIPATVKFPREHRFVLARAVQETALRFQERLIEAGLARGKIRQQALADADVDLTKLRFYLRLCQDLEIITPRQYKHVAEMVTEVGNLLGGWRRSIQEA